MELRHLQTRDEVASSFHVMKRLRSDLVYADYCDQVESQRAGGYNLLAAMDGELICGLAGYRHQRNLIYGRFTYLDDLVVKEGHRGQKIGERLLNEVRRLATLNGSSRLVLDTSLTNSLAQKFYFRNGLIAVGMHFGEVLSNEVDTGPHDRVAAASPARDATTNMVTGCETTNLGRPTSFDKVYDRRGTGSSKWDRYRGDILPMWLADMDFAAPPEVLNAIQTRLDHPILGYAAPRDELRSVILREMKIRYDWTISQEDILFLPGVMPGVAMALKGSLQEGDSVVVQPPVYGPMLAAPGHWNLVTRSNPLRSVDSHWVLNVEELDHALSRSKAFLFCNPQNPTGKVFTAGELNIIADICCRHDNLIISNETHCDLLFDGREHIPIASLSSDVAGRTVTLMSASKAYNIAGLKTAFAIIQNEGIRNSLQRSRLGMVDSVNAFGLEATLAAYQSDGRWKADMLSYLESNRDYLAVRLAEALPMLRIVPAQGTFLAWIDCSNLGLPDPHAFFLQSAKVALGAGSDFGDDYMQFVRLNFGCSRSALQECIDRMAQAVGSLRVA